MQLRIPGPTPCPPEALQSMGKQMINHRGKEFGDLAASVTEKLKKIYQTKEDVFVLTCAGTGGLEAAIVNTLSPGDKVLSTSNGVFGNRFVEIAEQYGANVKNLGFEWGKPVDLDMLEQALKEDTEIKVVLATQNETSTGMTNDIKSISSVVKKFDKLFLVDAISGLGCINLPTDEWNCDVVVTGSQKGFMIPPGLSMISMNKRAWQAYEQAKMPRYYMDLGKAKSFLEKGQTPWTPAVSIFFALDTTLDMMLKEGLENIFARHARIAQTVRNGVKALGLTFFSDERYLSNTVTAINADSKVDAPKLVKVLREEYDVVVAGGQKNLSGKIFRIGHLGWVSDKDADLVLEALGKALPKAYK